MILFPYAKDIEYIDKKLSFTISFLNDKTTTEISLTVDLDNELSDLIEGLFNDEGL